MKAVDAVDLIKKDFDQEFFHMAMKDGHLQIVQLTGESHAGSVQVNVFFESLKLFEVPDDDAGELEVSDDCMEKIFDLSFLSKSDFPYFALGYEPEYILFAVFPDLPDPFEFSSDEDREIFQNLATAKLYEVFS